MKRPHLSTSLLVFFCLALTSCYEKKEIEIEIGYLGDARRNAFLALEKLYHAYNYDASSTLSVDELPPDDTLLLIPATTITTPNRSALLLDWVSSGGHLVYMLNGTELLGWTEPVINTSEVPNLVDHPLLAAMDVQFGEPADGKLHGFSLSGRELNVRFPASQTFDLSATSEADIIVGDDKENAVLASIWHGAGRLTLLASAYPLRNRAIGNEDHASFAISLAELCESDRTCFIYGNELSFWSMIWKEAWKPLLGLIVLLLAWLWKALPSFGPSLPDSPALPRHFTDHLVMTAKFLWRHGSADDLLDPVRRRLVKRYQITTGCSLPDFHATSLHDYLAERSGLSKERIHAAMLANPQKDANSFTRLTQDLQLLESSL